MADLVRTFRSKSLSVQALVLILIVDPIAAALGYALHPQLGVDPLTGVTAGLMVAWFVPALWILRHAPDA